MSTIGDLDDQVTAAEKSVAELKRKAAELNDSTASEPKGEQTISYACLNVYHITISH